ncbi:MAG: hypothetical protein K2L12_04000 [Clostridia bacterium]|nr:hypothetical protein [Clostridia bacterium]
MTGKKKRQTTVAKPKTKVELSPEIAAADKLRLAALRAGKKDTKLRKEAYAELKAAKTEAQKNAVRAKYRDTLKQLKFEADKAYCTYDNYIKDNFDSGVVDNVKHPNGNDDYIVFTTKKRFINDLQKEAVKHPNTIKKNQTPASKATSTVIKSAAQQRIKRYQDTIKELQSDKKRFSQKTDAISRDNVKAINATINSLKDSIARLTNKK